MTGFAIMQKGEPMRLDEAILHCEEVADKCGKTQCGTDHRQLAEWLKELKSLRGAKLAESCIDCPVYDHERHSCPRYNRIIPEAVEMARDTAHPKRFYVIDTKDGMCRLCDWQYLEELALHEDWAKDLMYCDMEQFAIGEDGTLYLLDECSKWAYPPEGRFEIKWVVE